MSLPAPETLAAAREGLRRQAAKIVAVHVSERAERMLRGLESTAFTLQGYRGTGRATGGSARDFQYRMLRDKRRALIRHALRHGVPVREAVARVRLLAFSGLLFTGVPLEQARRWVWRFERRPERRAAA